MIETVNGFHIEPTNICTLKCPGCPRTRFIDQWPQHWKNHNLDIDQLLQFLDIDLTDKKILLCGDYGDPIYHPDFIDFVKKLKSRGSIITIITNGSYKKQDWWKELVNNLSAADTINFSVDGTPENFTEYRINADWESIRVGMDVVANSHCNSSWKYIPFSFNQADIKQVEKLSQNIGIKKFWVEFSDRFDEQTQHLIPDRSLRGQRYNNQTKWNPEDSSLKINPRCQSGKEHFIAADGYYSPCCHLADHRFYYKTIFGKDKKQYDIRQHTLSEILQQPKTIDFYQNLNQQSGCQYNCPDTTG
jgi:pyruvate-formate lyase-activating enzyme